MSVEMKVLTMAGTAYEIVDAKSRENVNELKNTKIDKSPTEWPIWTSEEQDTAREKMGAVSNSDLNWGNISGKPSSFPPTSHTHTAASIGAAATDHTHDDRYYTESELDSKLSGKSDTNHTHSTLNSPDGSELLYCYSNDGDTKTLLQTKSNSGDYSYCQFGNNTFYTGEGYRVYAEDYKPALTDLSGTLAVAHGGTGATTADGACDNIGAVKKSGDTMTGDLIIKSTRPNFHLKSSDDSLGRMWLAKETSDGVGYCVAERADTKFSGLYFDATAGVNDRVNVVDNIDGNWVRSPIYHNNMTIQIPIAQGGTGANTAAQARHNIGADHAYNLLDNSDFRNPVNQRGATTYTGSLYTIDRWRTWNSESTITITSNGIKGDGTEASVLYQDIEPNKMVAGKFYTTAAGYSDGSVSCGSGIVSADTDAGIWSPTEQVFLAYNNGVPFIRLWHATKTIAWVAIYEGSYTADTLPDYVPKGYAAELAECQRYFERLGVADSEILGTVAFAKSGAKSVIISMQYQPKRIAKPTISFGDVSKYRLLFMDAVNASVFGATQISSFDEIIVQSPFASVRVTMPNPLDRDCWVLLQREDGSDGAYIDVNADL